MYLLSSFTKNFNPDLHTYLYAKKAVCSVVTLILTFFFWGGEHPPDATEAFQLLPIRHLSLHHNGKDNLVTETGAVEQTPVM